MVDRPFRSGLRALGINLALSTASVLGLMVTIEVVLRVFGPDPRPTAVQRQLISSSRDRRLDCYPANPRGDFDIDLRTSAARAAFRSIDPARYDYLARVAPYAVETRYNSLGFRDREGDSPTPGERRLVVIGDSFAEGQGVKAEDTFARVIERNLNQADPGSWSVRVCARRGADFPALVELFDRALSLEPDGVIYSFVLNDPLRTAAGPSLAIQTDDGILDRDRPTAPTVFGSLLLGWARQRLMARLMTRATIEWYLGLYGEPNAKGWNRTQALIRQMRDRARERGVVLLIAVWPLLVGLDSDYPFEPAHRTIEAFCRQAGIEHCDLLPVLRGRSSQSLWVFADDRHPNALAHRLAAEHLAPAVRDLVRSKRSRASTHIVVGGR